MTSDSDQTDQQRPATFQHQQPLPQQQQQSSLSNQKSTPYLTKKRAGIHRNLADCCYSVSNLALIVACLLALVFAAKFLNDDSLYDYGEHLLTLRFYRQIVFIIVLLPLVLLVPLFNAISSFFLSERNKLELGKIVLAVKLTYQILLAILVLIGLIFVAPSIRYSSVAGQVAVEILNHMRNRYDNTYSYGIIDAIQEEYQCCDRFWYQSNLSRTVPLSCYRPEGLFTYIYEQDCADVIGRLVSDRCSVIAAGLFVILIALAILIAMDVFESFTHPSRKYDIESREAKALEFTEGPGNMRQARATHANGFDANGTRGNDAPTVDADDNGYLIDEISNRLKLTEREREIPLLPKTLAPSEEIVGLQQPRQHQQQQSRQFATYPSSSMENREQAGRARGDEQEKDSDESNTIDPYNKKLRSPPVLTKASYNFPTNRPQSPVFVSQVKMTGSRSSLAQGFGGNGNYTTAAAAGRRGSGDSTVTGHANGNLTPTKSALKKTSSFQRVDSGHYDDDEEEVRENLMNYQRQIHRELQTRRSLLNVRFAE